MAIIVLTTIVSEMDLMDVMLIMTILDLMATMNLMISVNVIVVKVASMEMFLIIPDVNVMATSTVLNTLL